MPKYKLTITYDGTNYCGWQIQPNGLAIQDLIQTALKTALRHSVDLVGSGRTDSGVHALGQIAHFSTDILFDPYRLLASLNGLLPLDIRILSIETVPDAFHARYSAQAKIYHYHIHLERFQNPFKRLYSTHIPYPVDKQLLQQAASLFLGTHDFTSFANEAHKGSAANNPVKTVKRLEIVDELGGIRFEFEADGFLYKMVRNIVGTLLEVASKNRPVETILDLFKAKDRKRADTAAPAQGLFLYKVIY